MSNDVIYDHRPFTIVYDDVISDIKDPLAIAVYVTLCKYANSDKVCHPSQKQIAEDLGLSASSVKTVRRALRSLEERGYLKQFRRWRDDKGGVSRVKDKRFSIPTSNGYVIFSELAGADKSVDKVDKSVEFDAQLGSFSPTTIGSADHNPLGSADHDPRGQSTLRTITNELEPIELDNNVGRAVPTPPPPCTSDPVDNSATSCTAVAALGDPQAGTPTHANHGTLQPVNESDPKGRKQGQGKSSKRQLDEEFERFWALVGRKRGKQQARKSFEKQRRTHDLEFICSQLMKAQAEWIRTGREPEYWPHPSTWLNQQLDDDYDTTSVPSQHEFYEARVQMLREQHVREKAQLNAVAGDASMSAITSTCVEDDDEDEDDDDWDWGA